MLNFYEDKLSAENTLTIRVSKATKTANTGADAIQKAPIVDFDTGVRCIRVGDLANSRGYKQWGFTKVSPSVFESFKLMEGDIIVSRTASLGLAALISENLDAVYNNGLIRLKVNLDVMNPLLMFLEFKTTRFATYINRINGETSVRPNMKINYLLDYSFRCWTLDKQSEILSTLTPLFSKTLELQKENDALVELRDSLLPKLMSGEIDVDSVEVD